jgi:hypothetical protein
LMTTVSRSLHYGAWILSIAGQRAVLCPVHSLGAALYSCLTSMSVFPAFSECSYQTIDISYHLHVLVQPSIPVSSEHLSLSNTRCAHDRRHWQPCRKCKTAFALSIRRSPTDAPLPPLRLERIMIAQLAANDSLC